MEFFQIILRARLLTRYHVILDKNSLKIIPRFNGVLPQAHKPIIGRLGEHNRQIVCHYVAVSPGGMYDDLVELHPLLGISLAIVGINLEDLEAYGPLYSLQPCCEGARSHRLDSGEWSEADGVAVLVVKLL